MQRRDERAVAERLSDCMNKVSGKSVFQHEAIAASGKARGHKFRF
jgi:hypothetical protein